MKIGLSNKLIFVQIYVPNLRKKWYTKGMKSLSEEEKYILALVEMDLDKLNDLGGENIMDEYVKEAEEVSFEGGVGELHIQPEGPQFALQSPPELITGPTHGLSYTFLSSLHLYS